MNRRNFLTNLAKSFFILPGAGRVWKAVTKMPDGYLTYTDIVCVRETLKQFVIPDGYFRFVPSFQDFLRMRADTVEDIESFALGKHKIKLILNNPPIIRPI